MWKWFVKYEDQKANIRKDIKKMTKHIMTINHDGHDYKIYELVTTLDMPCKRFKVLNQFIEDAQRSIQREELGHYMDEIHELLQKASKDDVKAFTDALVLTKWLKARTKIAMDVDLVMRVISACTLLEDEDPLDYDYDINDFKIMLFEKYGLDAFFLTEPIKKYQELITTSQQPIDLILDHRKKKRQVSKELKEMGISVWSMYKDTDT